MLEREVFVSLCAPFTFATHRHAATREKSLSVTGKAFV